MDTIKRACGQKHDKKAVHEYVLKMNKAVCEWSDHLWHDWKDGCLLQKSHDFGIFAAAIFDMSATAKAMVP